MGDIFAKIKLGPVKGTVGLINTDRSGIGRSKGVYLYKIHWEIKIMKRNQNGFTLIEIAIVLVIVGLLLGGVLKGQELINSAKVKNLTSDFKSVPVFIYGYQDKFKALPGDDAGVAAHVTGTLATTNGTPGNGIIDGVWSSSTKTDETYLFWEHVRKAGLAPGPTDINDPDYKPRNAVGGTIGVTSAAASPITGLKGTYIICSDAIAGKFARQIDTTLDDGNTATGSVMIIAAGTTVAGLPIGTVVDDTTYLVCMGV